MLARHPRGSDVSCITHRQAVELEKQINVAILARGLKGQVRSDYCWLWLSRVFANLLETGAFSAGAVE